MEDIFDNIAHAITKHKNLRLCITYQEKRQALEFWEVVGSFIVEHKIYPSHPVNLAELTLKSLQDEVEYMVASISE